MRMMLPALPVAILLVAACQNDSPVVGAAQSGASDVSLTTGLSSYSPGAEVELRLANESSGELGYNLCHSALQRLQGGEWVRSEPGMEHVCTMELRLLGRDGVATYTLQLPPDLPAGQYRFATTVERMQSGKRVMIASNTFEVAAGSST